MSENLRLLRSPWYNIFCYFLEDLRLRHGDAMLMQDLVGGVGLYR